METNYYLVRLGEGGKYVDEARKQGFIAMGWNEIPDINSLGNLEKIKEVFDKSSYKLTNTQISANAGQLNRFAFEIKTGDTVLSPKGRGQYYVGTVGDYYYDPHPRGQCPYYHRRHVQWRQETISKEDMSTNLAYAVGATWTIFSLARYAHELESLIAGASYTPAEKPLRIRDIVLSNLLEMDGKAFEVFISHLLEIVGFTAETTQYVSDKGIDVNGILDAEGLATITLRVQVKRHRSTIGGKEVRALRGALCQGEHGCLITLSNFSQAAIEEAEAPGKIFIKLIDGNDLAGLILKHFDHIDDQYKKRFTVRKKKDFNIEDQFEALWPDDEEEERVSLYTASNEPSWDTLVCAAKEEGFKEAFLDQYAWWAIRLKEKTIPFIKYFAIYRVAPISQITHYAEVDRIEPYGDTKKYKLYFKSGSIRELEKPVGLGTNPYLKPQGPKYACMNTILSADSLDDIFGNNS
ncbi:MAG: restriction endonuclease [Candidatus Aminicenantes bacterium]|nr:MAG: restriction endonuclease [Candidatus Aminicenantes bacterium]